MHISIRSQILSEVGFYIQILQHSFSIVSYSHLVAPLDLYAT